MKTTVADISRLLGGELTGDPEVCVTGVAAVDEAGPGDVVLADNARFFKRAMSSEAACVVTSPDMASDGGGKCVITVAGPAEAFMKVLAHFKPPESLPPAGIAPGAVVQVDAKLGDNVAIGPNCYVGSGASLGDGCVLFPNVCVGDAVRIGEGTKIYPGVTIYANCKIGKRVILHAGVVIGADGFGYHPGEAGLTKFPHTGTVEIGDDVEIGANSTIDRAKTGATVIGSGTKIDNLVQIAHNVKIGTNCAIVALSGIAGSVEIGNNVTLAAQAGIKDHVTIGDGSVVAARAGVIGNVAEHSTVSGFPARDHRVEKRAEAVRLRLPDILQRLRNVETELEKLSRPMEGQNGDAQH